MRTLPADPNFYKVLRSAITTFSNKENLSGYSYLSSKLDFGGDYGEKQLHQKLDIYSTKNLYVDELFLLLDEINPYTVLSYITQKYGFKIVPMCSNPCIDDIQDVYIDLTGKTGFLQSAFYNAYLDKELDESEKKVLLNSIDATIEHLQIFRKSILDN